MSARGIALVPNGVGEGRAAGNAVAKPFELARARYAKGKVAVRCLDGTNGERGQASRLLCAVAPGARYSHREHATICSLPQAKLFVEAYARGDDGVLGERNGILDWVLKHVVTATEET